MYALLKNVLIRTLSGVRKRHSFKHIQEGHAAASALRGTFGQADIAARQMLFREPSAAHRRYCMPKRLHRCKLLLYGYLPIRCRRPYIVRYQSNGCDGSTPLPAAGAAIRSNCREHHDDTYGNNGRCCMLRCCVVRCDCRSNADNGNLLQDTQHRLSTADIPSAASRLLLSVSSSR